ncbi:BZ3500_MvSof-1268-A1-R1_Chr1-1g01231 [Microbotryum saponariae]|uniref:BZ3500_MvSof-1268-A1-R1_Chr1-1g01231 protein n=1 Tax=Microbotryum saponariae TaxID=289078 RepID=A0A2X0KQE5_9BASI|nr:BZ3500_MvSof-1268-A1-R1_Chr1-1g01231 [Microbotryum saponariae]SCZ93736.1 BZ3501_MvSof-1269-A2-R1_Chr1-1g00827 [Microbotryum saponariae]
MSLAQASTSSSASTPIPDLVLPLFARSILDLLHVWPAVRIAITQGWAPSTAITVLAEDVVDLFYTTASTDDNPNGEALPDPTDVEDVLLHILANAFNLTLEDDSETQVAKDAIKIWQECLRRVVGELSGKVIPPPSGEEGILEAFEKAAVKAKAEDGTGVYRGAMRQGDESSDEEDGEGSGDDDDEDGMQVDGDTETGELIDTTPAAAPRRQEPEIDEDGFQKVTGKRGGRR